MCPVLLCSLYFCFGVTKSSCADRTSNVANLILGHLVWTSNFTRLLIPATPLVIWLPLKTDSKLKEAHTSLWLAFSYVSWSTSRQPVLLNFLLIVPLHCQITKNPNFLVGRPTSLDAGYSFADGCTLLTLWLTIFPASDFLDFGETWTEPRLLPALVLSRHHFLDCASPEFIHGFVHCCNLCISLLFR